MVTIRKAIESTYTGKCTIVENQKVKKENKSTGFKEKEVLTDQPCKLSFEQVTSNNAGENAALVVQTAKVFLAPEIQVRPGSKLIITQNGVTVSYKNSGEPATYSSHQEIVLELFKGWS